MATLVMDPQPFELEALIERRRKLGLDHHDEMWEGVLHMNPAPHGRHHRIQQQLAEILAPLSLAAHLIAAIGDFNLGVQDDYRVPDGAIHRPGPDHMYYPTAALIVEIVSPGDETWAKLPFYAAHDVDEVLIIDPVKCSVDWLGLHAGEYQPIERSGLIDLGPGELAEQLIWPSPASE